MRRLLQGLALAWTLIGCDHGGAACTGASCADAATAGRDSSAADLDAAPGPADASAHEDASLGCGDTSSNPLHCGECGHECASGSGACVASTCQAAYSPCIVEGPEPTTCSRACEALGAVCSAEGCGRPLLGFTASGEDDCLSGELETGRGMDWPCDEPINWLDPETALVRCCCAEK